MQKVWAKLHNFGERTESTQHRQSVLQLLYIIAASSSACNIYVRPITPWRWPQSDWTEVYIICFFVAPVRIAITALAKEFKASKDLEIITICTLFNSGQQTGKHISSVVNMWGQILMNDVERDESCQLELFNIEVSSLDLGLVYAGCLPSREQVHPPLKINKGD